MTKKEITNQLINKINKLLNEDFEIIIKKITSEESSMRNFRDYYRATIGELIISYNVSYNGLIPSIKTINDVEVELNSDYYTSFLPKYLGRKLVKFILKNYKESDSKLLINYLLS